MQGDATIAPGATDPGQGESTLNNAATPPGQAIDATPPSDAGQAAAEPTQSDESAAQTIEDSFTSLDPTTLPPEAKPFYDSMLKDYRSKTAEIADLRGNAPDWQAKADAFDGLMANDGFVKLLNAVEQAQNGTVAADNPATQSPTGEDLLLQILDNPNKLNELIRNEAEKLVNPIADRVNAEQAAKLHAELLAKHPDLPQHEAKMAEYLERSNFTLEPEEAYRLATYDAVKQAGINQGAQSVQKRNQAAQPASTPAPVEATSYGSIGEAVRAAFNAAGYGNG